MGYTSDGSLEDLWPEDLVERAAYAVTDRAADRLRDGVAQRTPVAKMPEAYQGNLSSWLEDRGGRRPGTLRGSWERGEIEVDGDVLRVDVSTNQRVASFVEDDTSPHRIEANLRLDPTTGLIRQGALRFPWGPTFVYRVEVWHPGTQGVHMMRDSLAEIEILLPSLGEQELRRVFREIEREP